MFRDLTGPRIYVYIYICFEAAQLCTIAKERVEGMTSKPQLHVLVHVGGVDGRAVDGMQRQEAKHIRVGACFGHQDQPS